MAGVLQQIKRSNPFSAQNIEITAKEQMYLFESALSSLPLVVFIVALGVAPVLLTSWPLSREALNNLVILEGFLPLMLILTGATVGVYLSRLVSLYGRIRVFDSSNRDATVEFYTGRAGMRDLVVRIGKPAEGHD